jgi:hypothetical protein
MIALRLFRELQRRANRRSSNDDVNDNQHDNDDDEDNYTNRNEHASSSIPLGTELDRLHVPAVLNACT